MPSKRLKIFLVDDSDGDLLLMKTAAREEPRLEVVGSASDGQGALTALGEEKDGGPGRPDLVILDINMPGMDGFETLTELKRDRRLRRIPVIMFSTTEREEDANRAYGLGAASFICKPSQFRRLVDTLHLLCDYWGPLSLLPGNR